VAEAGPDKVADPVDREADPGLDRAVDPGLDKVAEAGPGKAVGPDRVAVAGPGKAADWDLGQTNLVAAVVVP